MPNESYSANALCRIIAPRLSQAQKAQLGLLFTALSSANGLVLSVRLTL